MATAQKKSTGGKRTASSSGKRTGTSGKRASAGRKKAASQPKPIRREVGAAVCFLLAIFAAFGYFNVHAIFIDFFCGIAKGMIGYGFWLVPPMLLVSSVVLMFHRGRPVRLRVWCAMLFPVLVGALLHLMLAKGSYQLTLETWFSTNSTQLKQSRTLTYAIPLVVGGTSGGGGDDRPEIE